MLRCVSVPNMIPLHSIEQTFAFTHERHLFSHFPRQVPNISLLFHDLDLIAVGIFNEAHVVTHPEYDDAHLLI